MEIRARLALVVGAAVLAIPAAAGAGSAFRAAQCANVSVVTVNGDEVRARVRVPDAAAGAIQDLNVGVRIGHAFPSELRLAVVSPAGTVVGLADRHGPTGSDYGSGGTGCGADLTVFDDEATTWIGLGDGPFAGSYQPDGDLSDFDGEQFAGRWRLTVWDAGNENKGSPVTGTIEAVKLRARVNP